MICVTFARHSVFFRRFYREKRILITFYREKDGEKKLCKKMRKNFLFHREKRLTNLKKYYMIYEHCVYGV